VKSRAGRAGRERPSVERGDYKCEEAGTHTSVLMEVGKDESLQKSDLALPEDSEAVPPVG
jgi:hypothetical protein